MEAPAGVSGVRTPDGIDLAVHDLGGVGLPLVLAHATGFHGLVWAALATCLADTFRSISYDARGHGDSARPAEPEQGFDWYRLGADVLAVIDALVLERPALDRPVAVGHSSGGTALLLAELTRPGTFASIYCFEPVIIPAEPPLGRDHDNWLAAAARRRRRSFISRQEAFDSYSAKSPFDRLPPAGLWYYLNHGFADTYDGGVELKCRPEDEAVVYEMATAHNGFSRLAEVACPVTIACGSETEGFGPEVLSQSVERLPRARLEVLAGLGHLGPLEAPAAVAASIRQAFAPQVDDFNRAMRESPPSQV